MTENPLGVNEHLISTKGDGLTISVDQIEGTNYDIDALGGNAFRVGNTALFTFNNTVGAGEVGSSTVTTTFARPITKTIPLIMSTMYVDVDNDPTRIWPNGSVLTASPTTVPLLSVVHDHDRGDFNNGVYVFCFTYKNQSLSSQTYYFHMRYLVPLVRNG